MRQSTAASHHQGPDARLSHCSSPGNPIWCISAPVGPLRDIPSLPRSQLPHHRHVRGPHPDYNWLMSPVETVPRNPKIGVLFGNYIDGSFVCLLVLALQMPATNMGGYTKRTTSVALVFLAYCAGNIIGPHAFLAREAPVYQTGCKLIVACSSAQAMLAVCLRLLLF